MTTPSKPTMAQPPDSLVNPLFPDIAKILAGERFSGDGMTPDELTTRLKADGHILAAIQWAIYIAIERKWLIRQLQKVKTRSENAYRGTAEARSRLVDVEVLAPTHEFLAAWRAGALAVELSDPKGESRGSPAPCDTAGVRGMETGIADPGGDSATQPRGLVQPARVIWPIHGIWTNAPWQRMLADLAPRHGWVCLLNRWTYGSYSPIAFLNPFSREKKLDWFRNQYDKQLYDKRHALEAGRYPSVVAHSFGTYILGYALVRFDFIRFEKVLLCGSILPVDFPWDKLIERGQVQAVRNEFGVRDPWVKCVRWFVGGTGPSGAAGFTCTHDRLQQEKFAYDHSEYFGADHMEDRWMPFFEQELVMIPRTKGNLIELPRARWPVGLCVVVAVLFLVLSIIGLTLAYKYFWANGGAEASSAASVDYIPTSYTEAITTADDAAAAGDWTYAKSKLLNKYVRWKAFIYSTEESGYVIQPRKEASQNTRENAAVALADRDDHPPLRPGTPVTVTGRISKFDQNGITIVGATVTDGHTGDHQSE
jgi:hypothetical protein